MAYDLTQLTILKNEIDPVINLGGHPVTGAYNADAQLAANEMNAFNRSAGASPVAILDYLLRNEYRGENLYGRIAVVADAQQAPIRANNGSITGWSWPTVTLGDANADIQLTLDHVASAKALMRLTDRNSGVEGDLNTAALDAILNALAGGAQNAQCMGPAHKTALKALSDNRQSRANELSLPRTRAADVINARAL